MKIQGLCNATRAVGVLVLLCVVLGSASANVGGGGTPNTPWKNPPKNIQDIVEMKAIAAEYQTLSIPGELVGKTTNDLIYLYQVSLRVEEPREGDKVEYALVGKSSSGETVSVSFSQLESFIVTNKTDKTVTVSVVVWPDISAKELLAKQPTYKQLKADYRRIVILEMNLRSEDGRRLVFVGKGNFFAGEDEQIKRTLPLEKITVGIKGNFYGEHPYSVDGRRLWWAIPSVANDPDYPYRVILLK